MGVKRSLAVVIALTSLTFASDLAQHLPRWARLSLLPVTPSGFFMFTAHAIEMAEKLAFRLKLWLIVVAGLNSAGFHRGPFKPVRNWNQHVAIPATVKVAAVLSLVLWVGVISCGRMLAHL